MRLRNKKAQVTVFIILGLVLIISTLLFLGIKGKLSFFNPEAIIAPDKTTVKNYVQSCLLETSKDAVNLVAFQGGYAKELMDNRYWKARGGQYYDLFGGTGVKSFKIPYWWYEGDDFEPTKEIVEENIEWYIDQRLDQCLQNFTSLRKFYEMKVLDEPKSDVSLGYGKITIQLNYPIIIKTVKKRGDTEVNNYHITLNSNIRGALELAKLIKQDNDNHNRLLNRTIEVISGSDLPFKGIEFICEDKVWTMDQLKTMFDNYVKANLNYITYKNTQNEKIALAEYAPYYKNRYMFEIGAESRHKKYYVQAMPMASTSFNVVPNQGGLTVSSINLDLPLIGDSLDPCLNLYNHFYSVDYAVKFKIYDGEGLGFNFILPVNMKHNKLRTTYDKKLIYDDLEMYDIEEELSNSKYCKDVGSKEIVVYAKDEITNKMIPNASITYECVSFRCMVGITDYEKDAWGSVRSSFPRFKGGFPSCINGNLIVRAPDYAESSMFFTPRDQDEPLVIKLKPLVKLKPIYEFKKVVGSIFTNKDKEDYYNYTILTYVTNEDNGELGYNVRSKGSSMQEYIKIPLNHSGNNNLTFSIRLIDMTTNASIGGYEYNGMFDAKTIANSKNIILPVLISDTVPTTYEETASIYLDMIIPQSKKIMPRFS